MYGGWINRTHTLGLNRCNLWQYQASAVLLECLSRGNFVVRQRVIEEHHPLEPSLDESRAFNPTPFSDRLRETLRRYREAGGV